MRLTKILALLTGLVLVLHTEIPGATLCPTSTCNLTSGNDSLLKVTWAKFSKAVFKKNLKTFKAMSTDCLNCRWCVTNTAKEDSISKASKAADEKTWYDQLKNEFSFIPIDKFINEDYDLIFSKATKSRMREKYNVVFSDIESMPESYLKPCMIDKTEEPQPDFKEVILVAVTPAPKRGGGQMAFAFVKIKGQYKFCGFSVTPDLK